MKKAVLCILITVALLAVTSCSDAWYVSQRTFAAESLHPIKPDGLVFGAMAGKNWWHGTYNNKPVMIHAIQTGQYVNVNFQYIEAD